MGKIEVDLNNSVGRDLQGTSNSAASVALLFLGKGYPTGRTCHWKPLSCPIPPLNTGKTSWGVNAVVLHCLSRPAELSSSCRCPVPVSVSVPAHPTREHAISLPIQKKRETLMIPVTTQCTIWVNGTYAKQYMHQDCINPHFIWIPSRHSVYNQLGYFPVFLWSWRVWKRHFHFID